MEGRMEIYYKSSVVETEEAQTEEKTRLENIQGAEDKKIIFD